MDSDNKRRRETPDGGLFGGGGGDVPADRETRRTLYDKNRENRG